MAIPFHDRRTGQVLYHGTNVSFKPGDVIKPQATGTLHEAIQRGSGDWTVSEADRKTPMAFATPDLKDARFYANQTSFPDVIKRRQSKSRTPKVYHVEPINPKSIITGGKEVASPEGFRVLGVAEKGPASRPMTKAEQNELKRKRRRPHSVPPVTGLPVKRPEQSQLESVEDIVKNK